MGPPQNSNLILSFFPEIFEGLKGASDTVNNLIVEPTADFFQTIANYLSMFWNVILGTFENIAAFIRTVFTAVTVTNTIQPFIWGPIAASMTIVMLVAIVKMFLYGGNT